MFQKITSPYTEIPPFTSLAILGDPGCDGLGASTMSVFAKALNANRADLTLIVGDLVPTGIPKYYRAIETFINQIAHNPVYALCGNHDTDRYEEFCGLKNYALYSDSQLILVLDNSKRMFSPETIQFVEEALARYKREEILVAFHIPPPNRFTSNAISQEEWQSIETLLTPHKEAVALIVTGHVHSFFRDRIAGFPLVVTGGAGARIEFVHDTIPIREREYHYVEYKSVHRSCTFIPLNPLSYSREITDRGIQERLVEAYKNEVLAHFRYKVYAEEMFDIGEHDLSHLFLALSDSEYRHAKNHFRALNSTAEREEILYNAISAEAYEVETMYKEFLSYSTANNMGLSAYAFHDSLEAEKVHKMLLSNAQKNEFHPPYHTCTSCGFTFHGDEDLSRCPICGAPGDKIIPVKPS